MCLSSSKNINMPTSAHSLHYLYCKNRVYKVCMAHGLWVLTIITEVSWLYYKKNSTIVQLKHVS